MGKVPNKYSSKTRHLISCLSTFCIMGQRVTLCSKLKLLSVGEAKASLNRASSYME